MRPTRGLLARACAAVLLGIHVALAYSAAWDQSAVFDEPAHLAGGVAILERGDYRVQPENGVLPQAWIAIPLVIGPFETPVEPILGRDPAAKWRWGDQILYRLGNDPHRALAASRAMMLAASAALLMLVYGWSRRLFGEAGGLLSLWMAAFSPTILANAALATSDIFAALGFLAATGAIWRALRRPRFATTLVAGACTGGLLLVKASGLLIAPMAAAMAVVVVLRGEPRASPCGPRRRMGKLASAAASLAAIGLVACGLVWIGHAPGIRTDADAEFWGPGDPLSEPADLVERSIHRARDARILPRTYLYGLAYVHRNSQGRRSFFAGEWRETGWRGYFPASFLAKTPLPTLALLLVAAAAPFAGRRGLARSRARRMAMVYRTTPLWTLVLLYGGAAIFANLNIGHRHLLPIYPPLFVLAGSLGRCICSKSKWRGSIVGVLLAAQALTAVLAWPYYLAYFQPLAGGRDRAWRLFVDSSLDWGQDLYRLERRLNQADPRKDPVYLAYFGMGSPDAAGIDALRLPSFCFAWKNPRDAETLGPGLYAISATMLQSLYLAHWGDWSPYESFYQEVSPRLFALEEKGAVASEWDAAASDLGLDSGEALRRLWADLRFARLCAYLRGRGPDENVGGSILLFVLDASDLRRALREPLAGRGDARF